MGWGVGLPGGQLETTAIIHWGGNGGSGSRSRGAK